MLSSGVLYVVWLCADPGDVAFEDEAGLRYWLGPGGERLSEDPKAAGYTWVEHYSADMERPYYYNQVKGKLF